MTDLSSQSLVELARDQDALTEYLRQAIEDEANRQPATWDWYDLARAAARSLEAASSTPLVAPSDRSQRAVVEALRVALVQAAVPLEGLLASRRWVSLTNETWAEIENGAKHIRAALQPPAADNRTEDGLAGDAADDLALAVELLATGDTLAEQAAYAIQRLTVRTTGQPAIAAADNGALERAGAELATALHGFVLAGCPFCNGDCASANPPVVGCPMQAADRSVKNWNAALLQAKPVGEADV